MEITTSVNNNQKPWFKTWWVWVIILVVLGQIFKKDDSSANENQSSEQSENQVKTSVNPQHLSELNEYLQRGQWTCTNVESGTAPFMKGATFIFSNNTMIVSSGGTTVENNIEITGILPNVPEGSKYSALITINKNKDMLTWIDENLMVLSWGGDKAKLRLQR